MRPATTDTVRHEQLIADLDRHAQADARIRAAWLEGSFATGTSDAGSDVDLHVAVLEDDFTSFCEQARDWVGSVRAPYGDVSLNFESQRMFGFTLDDWVRLDLFVEQASAVRTSRPVTPRVLFDLDQLTTDFRVEPPPSVAPDLRIREVIGIYSFGFTFPARLSSREEWGSLHLNALLVVYQFLVPVMLAQRHPEQTYRPQLHNERFLDADQRAEVDALVAELARAFSTIPPDPEALRAVHRTLHTRFLAELRAAAETHDVPWPAETETAVRRFFAEELGVELG